MTEERKPPMAALTRPELNAIAETMPGGSKGVSIHWGYIQFGQAVEAEIHRRYAARDREVLAAFIARLNEKKPDGQIRFGTLVVQELGDLLGEILDCNVDTLSGRDPEYLAPRVLTAIKIFNEAYRAFVGAFDTPVARRRNPDEYCDDARQRLRHAALRFDSLGASLEAEVSPVNDPLEGLSDQAKAVARTVTSQGSYIVYRVEWVKYENASQRKDGVSYAVNDHDLQDAIAQEYAKGTPLCYTRPGEVHQCLVTADFMSQLLTKKVHRTILGDVPGYLGNYAPVQ